MLQPQTDYQFASSDADHTHAYLLSIILHICQKHHVKTVLDLGCGNGAMSAELARQGYEMTGYDPSESGISHAKASCPSGDFHVLGVYDNPQTIGKTNFDAVISTEVVEHLFSPRALPNFARQVLKPGGVLIVSTPYHGYLKNLLLSLLNKWDFHHTPFWDGGHIKFWSVKTLTHLLEQGGFTVTQFVGAGRIPFLWKSMVLVAQKK